LNKSITNRISSSVFFQFINIGIKGIVGIAIVPIIVKSIGIEKYGILELILSLMMINFFLEFGLGTTIVKFTANYRKKGLEELNKFIWTFLYFKSILAIIGMVVAIILGCYFEKIFQDIPVEILPEIRLSTFIFAIGLFISNIGTLWSNILKGYVRFDLSIKAEITTQFVFFVLMLSFYKLYDSFGLVIISILMFVIRPLVRTILLFFFIKAEEPGISFMPVTPSKRIFYDTIHFLGGISLITIIAQIYNRFPRIILGILTNPVSVAIFGMAERLRNPILQIHDSILRPLVPAGTEYNLSDPYSSKKIILKVVKYQSLIIMGIVSLVIIYIPYFINLWVGNEFIDTAKVMRILLIPFMLPNAGVMLMLYYSKGKTRANVIFVLINTIIGVSLAYILAAKFGVFGLVTGMIISLIIIAILQIIYYCKEFQISICDYLIKGYLRPYCDVILTSLITILLLQYIDLSNWFSFFFTGILSVVIYFSIAYVLFPKEEIKKIILSLIRK